ncbi:MAG: hypothetical protein E6Q34_00975 [Burkholderiaceae bacterium]|nr:MAG: hypothetical protein E6Q34_00975 [Burkholderiaceae bacterium]
MVDKRQNQEFMQPIGYKKGSLSYIIAMSFTRLRPFHTEVTMQKQEPSVNLESVGKLISLEHWLYLLLAIYIGFASCILLALPHSDLAHFLREKPEVIYFSCILIVAFRGHRAGLPLTLSLFHPARKAIRSDELFQLTRRRASAISFTCLLLLQPILAIVFSIFPSAKIHLLLPTLNFAVGVGCYAALTLYLLRERNEDA